MSWWAWLIIGGAVFIVAVTITVLVFVFGVFRTVKGEFDQTSRRINGSLWGTEFEKRPGRDFGQGRR